MKIILCDDHAIFRSGLRAVLSDAIPSAEIIEMPNAESALARIATGDVDLVLLDLEMPGTGGWAALRKLRSAYPTVVVVIVSASESARAVRQALDAGASGFVPKSSNERILKAAIEIVLSGGIYVPPQILESSVGGVGDESGTAPSTPLRSDHALKLTPRQREVLVLMSRGLSNREIAELLEISPSTVKTHLAALFSLLDVSNRTEATLVMRELEIEDDDSA